MQRKNFRSNIEICANAPAAGINTLIKQIVVLFSRWTVLFVSLQEQVLEVCFLEVFFIRYILKLDTRLQNDWKKVSEEVQPSTPHYIIFCSGKDNLPFLLYTQRKVEVIANYTSAPQQPGNTWVYRQIKVGTWTSSPGRTESGQRSQHLVCVQHDTHILLVPSMRSRKTLNTISPRAQALSWAKQPYQLTQTK